MERAGIYKVAERAIPESQLRDVVHEMVRQCLTEMLGINTPSQQRQWHDTDPAYSLLGLDSAEQLRVMVRDGALRIGHEVRDVRSPSSQVPRYQFHLGKCEERLNLPPEKRAKVLKYRKSSIKKKG